LINFGFSGIFLNARGDRPDGKRGEVIASLLAPLGRAPISLDKVAQDLDISGLSTLETVDFAAESEFSP